MTKDTQKANLNLTKAKPRVSFKNCWICVCVSLCTAVAYPSLQYFECNLRTFTV